MIEELRRIFSQFEPELLQEISSVAILEEVPANTLLMDVGLPIRSMPLILSGNVKIFREDEDGRELFLYYIEGGEACALSLICSGRERISKIKAITMDQVRLLRIPMDKMDEWMRRYSSWYLFVLETYQFRLEGMLHTIDQIAFKNMDERLLNHLRVLSEAANSYVIEATHRSIASELGTSREVISRLLKRLEHRGVIALSRNHIKIIDLFA
ncbi:MAG: Crp/Fnr family transcriptional regulator [Bacteroidetes bacterium]|nr:Crp/Fnr family transcriptional regulator [Bacteroidota bacterium]MDA0931445.1 Crp/Fnr family transcriptional regulator [Bacteroidota bacterium]